MTDEEVLDKFEDLRKTGSVVVYGYRYFKSKIENYISISNLRLEIIQVNKGRVLYTLAAPILQVSHNKNKILFTDNKLVVVTDGPRANIVLREQYLKDGEEASPVQHFGTTELTVDSDIKLLKYVVEEVYRQGHIAGIGIRLPMFYRCTKNPERLRLNFNETLLENLGLETNCGSAKLKEAFLRNIDTLASKTEKGYVIDFSWVNAGGMVVALATAIGSKRPIETDIRLPAFFNNSVKANGWEIELI